MDEKFIKNNFKRKNSEIMQSNNNSEGEGCSFVEKNENYPRMDGSSSDEIPLPELKPSSPNLFLYFENNELIFEEVISDIFDCDEGGMKDFDSFDSLFDLDKPGSSTDGNQMEMEKDNRTPYGTNGVHVQNYEEVVRSEPEMVNYEDQNPAKDKTEGNIKKIEDNLPDSGEAAVGKGIGKSNDMDSRGEVIEDNIDFVIFENVEVESVNYEDIKGQFENFGTTNQMSDNFKDYRAENLNPNPIGDTNQMDIDLQYEKFKNDLQQNLNLNTAGSSTPNIQNEMEEKDGFVICNNVVVETVDYEDDLEGFSFVENPTEDKTDSDTDDDEGNLVICEDTNEEPENMEKNIPDGLKPEEKIDPVAYNDIELETESFDDLKDDLEKYNLLEYLPTPGTSSDPIPNNIEEEKGIDFYFNYVSILPENQPNFSQNPTGNYSGVFDLNNQQPSQEKISLFYWKAREDEDQKGINKTESSDQNPSEGCDPPQLNTLLCTTQSEQTPVPQCFSFSPTKLSGKSLENFFKCSFCDSLTTNIESHIQLCLKNPGLYRINCNYCDMCFDLDSITTHMSSHYDIVFLTTKKRKPKQKRIVTTRRIILQRKRNKWVKCKFCNKRVKCRVLSKHTAKHTISVHHCEICGHPCLNYVNLCSHILKKHFVKVKCKKIETERCWTCKKNFESPNALVEHVKTQHADECFDILSDFECTKCNKNLTDLFSWKIHAMLNHNLTSEEASKVKNPKGYRLIQCSVCRKSFGSEKKIRAHMKDIHNMQNNEIIELLKQECERCGKKFVTKQTLLLHINAIHLNIRPITCELCGSKFTKKSSLIYHKWVHSREKNFKCMHCRLKFRQRNDVIRHIAKHVRDNEVPFNDACAMNVGSSAAIKKRKIYFRECKFNFKTIGKPDETKLDPPQ